MEIPWDGRHPAQDHTGSQALRNQSGPVWYLTAATTKQPITRNISIPDDVRLFVGIADAACTNVEEPPFYGGNEAEMRDCAEKFIWDNLYCEIDGATVTNLEGFQVTSTQRNCHLCSYPCDPCHSWLWLVAPCRAGDPHYPFAVCMRTDVTRILD